MIAMALYVLVGSTWPIELFLALLSNFLILFS